MIVPRFILRWLQIGICLLMISATARGQAVRLAIVPEGPEASMAANFLTAQLSKQDQVVLLEREQIDKVYREQGLAGGGKDLLKLGQLLGADGLLMLQSETQGETKILSVRLVAVKTGITLDLHEYPWPVDNQEQWSAVLAAQFKPLLPKLTVAARDAVPISIVDLRSALASIKTEELERELTSLLYNRLLKERDIFVLERRRMDLLAEEKQLNPAAESSFWNGSFLIDGVIDKEGIDQDKLTFDLRLTPRDKQGVISLAVSGPRTNLPVIVNELVVKIMAAIKVEATTTKWDTLAEADRYFTEAEWMFKWHLYREAVSASETALALGRQTREVSKLRIKAYQELAGSPGIGTVDRETHFITFGQQINLKVVDHREIAATAKAFKPEQFEAMAHATELYADSLRQFASSGQKLDPEWLALGNQVLSGMSSWLRYFYFTVEARAGREEKLEEARAACREIVATITSGPDIAKLDANHAFLKLEVERSPFWTEKPEHSLQFYRKIRDAGQWPLFRPHFFSGGPFEEKLGGREHGITRVLGSSEDSPVINPCVAGWNWEDRKRMPGLWQEFIRELCASPKPLVVLEGRILQCSYSWSEVDFEKNLTELLLYIEQHESAIVASGLGENLAKDIQSIIDLRVPQLTDDTRTRIGEKVWPDFERRFNALAKNFASQRTRRAQLEERLNYLKAQTNFDFSSFADKLLSGDYQPAEASEMLSALTNYASRIKQNLAPVASTDRFGLRKREMDEQQAGFWIGNLEKKLEGVISPPPPNTNAVTGAVGQKNPLPPGTVGQANNIPGMRPKNAASNAEKSDLLKVTYFWKIPNRKESAADNAEFRGIFQGRQRDMPQIASSCYRDGRLWLEVRYDMLGFSGRADFIGVDLSSGQAVTVPFLGQDFSLPGLVYKRVEHPFEVYHEFIYLSLGESVRRYSLKNQSWEEFTVPGGGSITRLGDRLFFTTDNSIVEYTPEGAMRVLASSRRRPAVTSLDALDNYGCHLFLTADQTLHACIRNAVYAFSPTSNDWVRTASVSSMDKSRFYSFDDGFMVAVSNPANQWWGKFGKLASPEPLFRQSRPGLSFSTPQLNTSAPARWHSDIPSLDLCVEGDRIWFVVGVSKLTTDPAHHLQIQAEGDQPLTLLCYKIGDEQPIGIPIQLATDKIDLPSAAANRMHGSPTGFLERTWFVNTTPQGLVLVRDFVPGFWLIPRADLDRAIGLVYSRQSAKQKAREVERKRIFQELSVKYDRNHNGILEPEEKESMINDPPYLEWALPEIDKNHNGLLEAEELLFFDVNNNGLLDPAEQEGIEKVLDLLATRLIEGADTRNDGRISRDRVPAELFDANSFPGPMGMPMRLSVIGIGKADLTELMQSHLGVGMRRQGTIPGQPPPPQLLGARKPTIEYVRQRFKERVEAYWKTSKSNAAPASAFGKPAPNAPTKP